VYHERIIQQLHEEPGLVVLAAGLGTFKLLAGIVTSCTILATAPSEGDPDRGPKGPLIRTQLGTETEPAGSLPDERRSRKGPNGALTAEGGPQKGPNGASY